MSCVNLDSVAVPLLIFTPQFHHMLRVQFYCSPIQPNTEKNTQSSHGVCDEAIPCLRILKDLILECGGWFCSCTVLQSAASAPSAPLEKTGLWPVVLYSGYPEVIFHVLIACEGSF